MGVYKNFFNASSLVNSPSQANTNQTVTISTTDTSDWIIDKNTGGLLCVNSGTWNILSQYQVCGINTVSSSANAQIDGWFIVNGQVVPQSDANSTTSNSGDRNVLAISLTSTFKTGDLVQFGIRSSSTNQTLNAQICNTTAPSGIGCPALIVTGNKVPSCCKR